MLGARFIREHGGSVLAQDQASSAVWGMPGAVANAGLAHKVPVSYTHLDVYKRQPLTLAIIPALIVRSLNQSFALPQGALSELVHIPPEQAAAAIEWIENAPLYRLREMCIRDRSRTSWVVW